MLCVAIARDPPTVTPTRFGQPVSTHDSVPTFSKRKYPPTAPSPAKLSTAEIARSPDVHAPAAAVEGGAAVGDAETYATVDDEELAETDGMLNCDDVAEAIEPLGAEGEGGVGPQTATRVRTTPAARHHAARSNAVLTVAPLKLRRTLSALCRRAIREPCGGSPNVSRANEAPDSDLQRQRTEMRQ